MQMNVLVQPQAGDNEVLSKVIVVEHEPATLGALKTVFEQCKLVGYRATRDSLQSILSANIDLGGIFLPATDAGGGSCVDLVGAIHKQRPELPIFLRLDAGHTVDGQSPDVIKAVAGAYAHGDLAALRELIDTYLLSRDYPGEFIAAMAEMTREAMRAAFRDMQVELEQPYIVKDKIIYGELFSLIPLESSWCRGYMMLQTEEEKILGVIKARKTQITHPEPNFRHVNAVLGELSNMVWGAFKNKYGAKKVEDGSGQIRVEIPIIVNHARKYISFGSDDPQLCFKYSLVDPLGVLDPVSVYQKFIFSLDWAPEKYAESNASVNELVSTGELELF